MALAGKKVLVTGGKRSIGRGIALAMAEAGADVAINDLEEDEDARETLRLLAAAGGRRGGALRARPHRIVALY
jgi:NAD(P)-dependent dehydrogenase (short-subunit alcohol dehydrogenase family)